MRASGVVRLSAPTLKHRHANQCVGFYDERTEAAAAGSCHVVKVYQHFVYRHFVYRHLQHQGALTAMQVR